MSGAVLPSNPSSSKGQRYALVVGANSAPHISHLSPLKSAEEDALSVASVLQERCDCTLVCEPLLGVNATASAVRQALNTLAVRRTDDDILLFYFAGHGFIHEDPSGQRHVYLATSDLDAHLIQEGEDIDSISLDWLRERLYEKTKAGRVLLILDCCYAGNIGRIPGDLPLNTIFDLFKHYLGATNDVSLRKYRVTIAATGHDAEASEKSDHSMTNHLLTVLRGEYHTVLNLDGEVTIGRLYDHLYQIMPAEQKPSFSGDTAGRGLVLATYPEYSAQALQADQREERRERLQILSAAPDGERFLRDRLESFVGRETELHDIQQRIAAVQPSGGYVTITGQAGQGKSSIIAALIAQYASTSEERERIPFHFIPFNPGPEYQVTLLRNLMARLILKYDLSDLYVASESRPALRDFFPKVLRDVAAKGGQEMIFIDGLDQIESDSNGVRDLSFLPTNPPEGIVFVLGTRPDDTLKPLTLLKPTQPYLLPPLSREDFSILLQQRQVPFLEPRLADQFYEKMQQNALYLDLLARELHNQGSITPDAIETIIRRLAEDPNNIFSFALERLARRGDWHEVVKPLLGIFLVTYEPLTPWQLRTILNLDHQQIQNGLQCLSGLVTHIEQRYALYHLKFQDFLRQDEARPDKPCIFATDEEVGYHARLVQWCERDQLSRIWEDTRDSNEQRWRVYVRHHYISHLYASRQPERLFVVLDEQSYGQSKERYDVGARSYIQDLKKGCLAATWDGWTDEQHLKYLSRLWRYTLLRCSIQSTADQYPLDLFKVMLLLGKEREVAGLIELITEPNKKVQVMLLLAQHLFQSPMRKQEGSAIYLLSAEVAYAIKDTSQQAEALITLVSALIQAQQWKQAEEVARSLQDADEQTEALIALVSALIQAQQWKQAEEVACFLQDADEQTEMLTDLASALTQAQQWGSAKQVFLQAEKAAYAIKYPYRQAKALVALAIALTQAQQWGSAKQVFLQAEKAAYTIKDTSRQVRTLTVLAIALAQARQWQQADDMARFLQDAYGQAEALTALATALAQAQQWQQAEEVARFIKDISWRAETLIALASTLAQAQQEESAKQIFLLAEEVAHSLQDTYRQAKVLTALATALAQAQQWQQAEEVARFIKDTYQQAEALTALTTALAQAQQWQQAEEVARFIKDTYYQVRTLTALATALAQAQQWQQAGEIAHSLQDTYQQAEALTALTIALALAQQWQQAKEVARFIKDTSQQAKALMALASALTQAHQWKEAEEVAYSIIYPSQETEALIVLATALAQAQQEESAKRVFLQAEEIACFIKDISTLTVLATALAQAQQMESAKRVLSQVEMEVRSYEDTSQQAKALMALASALAQAHQWKEAEEVAYSIIYPSQKTEALIALATALAQAQQEESAKRVFLQAEEVTRSLPDDEQAKALIALATALAQAQQEESAKRVFLQAEEVTRSLPDEYGEQARTLRDLASALAQAHQWQQAEEIAQSLGGIYDEKAGALMTLDAAQTQAQHWEQAEEVKEDAHTLQGASQQAEALLALTTTRIEQGDHSHLLPLVQRSWQCAETRNEALDLLPLASGLITQTPALGMELYAAFQWVDDFLSGS